MAVFCLPIAFLQTAAVAANVLDRSFDAPAPSREWIADFTYVWTAEGWLYVAAVVDLFSRRVVGWSMSTAMTAQRADLSMREIGETRLQNWSENDGYGRLHSFVSTSFAGRANEDELFRTCSKFWDGAEVLYGLAAREAYYGWRVVRYSGRVFNGGV